MKNLNWALLFSTQFWGVLNDNLLKTLVAYVGVTWVAEEHKGTVIGVAGIMLVVSFLFSSQFAGKLASEYKKLKVLRWLKFAEIPIMVLAVAGFYFESIVVVMTSVFFMGLQSALYSPSKYGLIRDVDGIEKVSFGNGTMELFQFIGILLGTLLAGIIADIDGFQKEYISIVLIVVAVLGWLSTKGLRIKESEPQPYDTSINPFKFFDEIKKYASSISGLNTVIVGLAGFWLVGGMIQMTLIEYMEFQYQFTSTNTSIVIGLMAIGIGLGCFTAGLLSKNHIELGIVPIGGIGMTLCLIVICLFDLRARYFSAIIMMAAFFSGWFKIPLNAWVQERVKGRRLGDVLAYNNMVVFGFILIGTIIYMLVSKFIGVEYMWLVILICTFAMTLITISKVPEMMVRFICYVLMHTIYSVKVNGVKNIPKNSGALLIVNHLSLLDGMFVAGLVPRRTRFIMLKGIYENKLLHPFFKKMNVIPVDHKNTKENLEAFTKLVQDEINAGHIVCIYAEGQLSRVANLLGFKKGVEHIGKGIDAPIIPIHIDNLEEAGLVYSVKTGKLNKPSIKNLRRHVAIKVGESKDAKTTAHELRYEMLDLAQQNFDLRLKQKMDFTKFIGVNDQRLNDLMSQSSLDEQDVMKTVLAMNQVFPVGKDAKLKILTDNEGLELILRAYCLKYHINIDSKPDVLIGNGNLIDQYIQENGTEDLRVIVSDQEGLSKVSDEIRYFKGLVLEEGRIISLETPGFEGSDLVGNKWQQLGYAKESIGRQLPGTSFRIMKDNQLALVEEYGDLFIKEQNQDMKSTGLKVKMDKEGFLYL